MDSQHVWILFWVGEGPKHHVWLRNTALTKVGNYAYSSAMSLKWLTEAAFNVALDQCYGISLTVCMGLRNKFQLF